MKCRILRDFPFSRDGITSVEAKKDEEHDVPDVLVLGLEQAGYVEPLEDSGALHGAADPVVEPDSSASAGDGATDDGDDLEILKNIYKEKVGRPPHWTWDADKIREKLAELVD